MQSVLDIGKWVLAHYQEVIVGATGVVSALIALALVIPGEQPEKALQKALDFLAKFSKK
jgi:hypothetical protein